MIKILQIGQPKGDDTYCPSACKTQARLEVILVGNKIGESESHVTVMWIVARNPCSRG